LKFDDIRVIGNPLVKVDPADVDALEARLWFTFPAGYRDYVTRLGEGVLGGSLVRVYPPWRIEKELDAWRRRIDQYWFWDAGRALLPKERAIECVILGDTTNGDELVFHPTRPGRLFVLPRDSGQVFEVGGDLLSAIEWMCSSGKLVEPFAERDFEPFDSRKELAEAGDAAAAAVSDPKGESLNDLLDAARRWAKRHDVRKQAQKEAKRYARGERKLELIYESLVLDGDIALGPAYAIGWRVVDKKTGLELGVFRWDKSDSSQGSKYEPNNENVAKLGDSGPA
jgi:hypothetical protein